MTNSANNHPIFGLNPPFLEEQDRRAREQNREKADFFVAYVSEVDVDGKRAKILRDETEDSSRPPFPILGGSAAAAGIVEGNYAWCLGSRAGAVLILGQAVSDEGQGSSPDSGAAQVEPATEQRTGVVEYADGLEASQGVRTDRVMSPKRTRDATLDVMMGRGPGKLLTDYSSLQAAFDALPNNGVLIVPGGDHEVSSATVNDKAISIRGYGQELSRLVFSGSGGIKAVHGEGSVRPFYLSDTGLFTRTPGGGTALEITYDSPSSVRQRDMCTLNGITVRGLDEEQDYWDRGIVTHDTWGLRVLEPNIRGKPRTFNMSVGIQAGGFCSEVRVVNLRAFHVGIGVRLIEETESCTLTACSVVYADVGFALQTAVNRPGCWITDCHANTFTRGFDIFNRNHGHLSGCVVYKRGESNVSGFQGIRLSSAADQNGQDVAVHGCYVTGNNDQPDDVGIWVGKYRRATIMSNTNFERLGTGVYISPSAENCIVAYNGYTAISGAKVDDRGSGTLVEHNRG